MPSSRSGLRFGLFGASGSIEAIKYLLLDALESITARPPPGGDFDTIGKLPHWRAFQSKNTRKAAPNGDLRHRLVSLPAVAESNPDNLRWNAGLPMDGRLKILVLGDGR